jgi:hypothetical protein
VRLILTQPYLSARGSEENCQKIEALIGSVKNEILPDDILLLPDHLPVQHGEHAVEITDTILKAWKSGRPGDAACAAGAFLQFLQVLIHKSY